MRALVLFCHPSHDSFSRAVLSVVNDRLRAAGAEIRLRDLYAEGYEPTLSASEWEAYLDEARNTRTVRRDVEDLRWCDALIFVYPTWWYGLPALLKGWLDRALVPGVAFLMPDARNGDIRPGLTHVARIGVFTTCGASRWLTWSVGAPGRRTLLRGLRIICAPRCRTAFEAHYSMDSSTPESRNRHLDRVAAAMDRLTGGPVERPSEPAGERA